MADAILGSRCGDCGALAAFGVFDGARIRQVCEACSVRRRAGAVPGIQLGDGWIIGHAAQTGRAFRNTARDRAEMFARGCFRQTAARDLVVLGVNHECCRCKYAGRSIAEGDEALIDWNVVLASTRDGTLWLEEDPYGLFFAAHFPVDACVSYDGAGPPVNIHDAIARGECRGLSLHLHRGDRVIGRAGIPVDVFAYSRIQLQEISLIFAMRRLGLDGTELPPGSAGTPGTWALPAGQHAMDVLYGRLRDAPRQVSAGRDG